LRLTDPIPQAQMQSPPILLLLLCYLISSLRLGSAYLLPKWPPTYNMSQSTIIQPCNYSGYFSPEFSGKWAIISYDWSNAKQMWANQKPMNCEDMLLKQAQATKQYSNTNHVWVYRNLVKALPWFEEVREKILDSNYAGWFLKFKPQGPYHVSNCTTEANITKCSQFYHDKEQTPGHPHGDGDCIDVCDCGEGLPCGEYLFDHRNASLQDFLINTFILGPRYGMGTKVINGFFLDDGWSTKADPVPWWAPPDYKQCDMYETGGPTEEDYYCTVDMGLTHEEVVQIATNYSKTWEKAVNAIVDNGGFGWPLLQYSGNFGRNQSEDPPTRPDNCKSFLRRSCVNGSSIYTAPLLYTFTGTQAGSKQPLPLRHELEDVATFLLIRGPYAWLGFEWSGCCQGDEPPSPSGGIPYPWSKWFDLDYGEPVDSVCHETAAGSGVFAREWTKAHVQMDCNAGEGSITFK